MKATKIHDSIIVDIEGDYADFETRVAAFNMPLLEPPEEEIIHPGAFIPMRLEDIFGTFSGHFHTMTPTIVGMSKAT